jgi:anti-sigma-K factor RskA
MSASHEEQTLAAAYVLDALDPDERRAFEVHLDGCATCAEEIRSLGRVAELLPHTVPQHTPPAALRARMLGAVLPAAQPVTEVHHRARSSAWLPLAAAIVAAAGLGVYSWQLQQRVRVLEARLDAAERRASTAERDVADARRTAGEAQASMAVLAAPDLVRVELAGGTPAAGARARALWSRNRGMVFTASNLPQAPEGRVYQVWVVTAGGPISAGLMTPDASGRAEAFFNTPQDIPPPTAIAVTLEPAGGVPAPTGEPYLTGTPAL